jgi:hypothetical protein
MLQAGVFEDSTESTALESQDSSKEQGNSLTQFHSNPGNTGIKLCSPLYVPYVEIQRLYEQFKDECGALYFSHDFFLTYVTYAAREARLSAFMHRISKSGKTLLNVEVAQAAVDSLELCQLSM